MNWLNVARLKSLRAQRRIVIKLVKSFFALLLIASLTSCGDKAVSTEPSSVSGRKDSPQLTNQISEVAPPFVIQELKRNLDNYRPQVTILTPKSDEVLSQDTVEITLQVKDLPIFKDSQFNLGSHLQVILDEQFGIEVYDLQQPLNLSSLTPGTHTLRVFAEKPWYESYKSEGAYAQTTFHVFTKTDEHNPDTSQPLLTYNRPNGEYGAEPILLDFYLTNTPLQLNGKDILQDDIGDWRIRCTINDESFVLDRWESIYLKGFKPGKNWVKLEFLDGKGEVVKNVFNSTVRSFTYEPKGKDTLSRIVRGELSADQVRSIVDPTYVAKEPTPEPTPTTEPIPEPTPTTEPTPEPTPIITPTIEPTPEAQPKPEKPKSGGYFKRQDVKAPLPTPTIEPTPIETPDLPEVIITPTSEPEATNTPNLAPEVEKPTPEPEITPTPEESKPVIESPTPEPEVTPSTKPSSKVQLGKYFKRRESTKPTPEPTLTPAPEITPQITPIPEITPEKEITPLPEVIPTPLAN
jgi:hypothetical protein